MDATTLAVFISIFSAVIVSLFPLMLSGQRSKAAEEKAHARRIAEARMNARLLRFNL